MKTKREIRFRVWDSKAEHFWKDGSSGEDGYGWNEDWLCITMDGQVAIFDSASSVYVKSISALTESYGGESSEQDRFVIQQFTGLKDKNGKEIYEGDILLFNLEGFEVKGVVEYIGNGFWIKNKRDGNFMPDIKYREVVGNVFENPNLLSEKEE